MAGRPDDYGGYRGGAGGGGYGGQHDGYDYGGYGGAANSNRGYGYGMPQGGGYPPMGGPGGYGFDGHAQSPLDAEIKVVIHEIHGELGLFDQSGEWGEQFKNARRLLAAEADKLENSIDPEWLEVDIPKPIKVTKKVLIPNFRHNHFNFVGKILGPRGAALQSLAKTHKCHIYVLGRGSTKDRAKENELLASGDPQYAHYGGPLHVKVETIAPAHVAYQRIAGVLEELNRVLQPIREDTTPAHLKEEANAETKEEGSSPDKNDDTAASSNSTNNGFRGGRGGGGAMMRGRGGGRGRGDNRGGRGGGFRPY